ncbi:MAG: acyltransferase family protein [Rhodoblastus sp.]
MSSQRFEFANILRGLAAVSVVISHLALGYWLDPATISLFTGMPTVHADPPAIARFFQAIPINFGSFGVGLFFVISGFVIPYSLVAYDVRAFLVGRFFRIYPTFWAGLAISVAALAVAAHFFGAQPPVGVRQVVLHGLAPLRPIFESRPVDGVVWTLEVELFFYCLCALLAREIALGRRRLGLAPVAIFILWAPCFIMSAVPPAGYEEIGRRMQFLAVYAPFLILMFVGVAYNLWMRGKLDGREACVWIAGYMGLFAATWATRFLGPDWKPMLRGVIDLPSYLTAVAVFFICAALRGRLRQARLLDFFARISYSLYVAHQLAGYVALRYLTGLGVEANLATVLAIVLAIALAFVLHVCVEGPTHRFGQAMARRMAARRRTETAAATVS